MAYLHENREAFEDAINHTRDVTGFTAPIVEKDYYTPYKLIIHFT